METGSIYIDSGSPTTPPYLMVEGVYETRRLSISSEDPRPDLTEDGQILLEVVSDPIYNRVYIRLRWDNSYSVTPTRYGFIQPRYIGSPTAEPAGTVRVGIDAMLWVSDGSYWRGFLGELV